MGLVEALHHHAGLRLLRRHEYESLPLRLWFAPNSGWQRGSAVTAFSIATAGAGSVVTARQSPDPLVQPTVERLTRFSGEWQQS